MFLCHIWSVLNKDNRSAFLFTKVNKTLKVNFNNELLAVFTLVDPKSTKRHWWLECLYALLGYAHVKALLKKIDEIDPRLP